ncbi:MULTISPECIES: copper chaperone CopZ [Clostridia]|uniref:copper chaperone CopZ n=1 Tax=Clostridia TaxID=186801 RepID=UPI000EA22B62|nr:MULTISPECIES: copper chaperone CopZ [Clostridia]NBJ71311.1 copper chaperone [Roseburia sp. 1XD42-34]RKI74718.1 copper chaperone [Clostridium sp. 1xD42-85]
MQTTLDVRGMTCGHCEKSVKGALEALPGVIGVEVHLDTGKVDVTYDDAKTNIQAMREAIEEQGYDVVV